MLSFKDFLQAELIHITESEELQNIQNLKESPIAAQGHLSIKIAKSYITELVLNLNWELRGSIQIKGGDTLYVYKLKSDDCYIVGEMIQEDKSKKEFVMYTRIQLQNESIKGTKYKSVKRVETREQMQGQGIATALYKFLVKEEKIDLISDSVQFFGARKLWVRLSDKMKVHVLDSDSGSILMKNVELKHGISDEEIDERVWSYVGNLKQDYSKHNIRFILKDIQ